MARFELSYDSHAEESADGTMKFPRDTYRVRRATASRRRTRKKSEAPIGDMRLRRSKRWTW